MKRAPCSISCRLFVWLLGCSAIIFTAVGLFLYYEVEEIVLASADRALHSKMEICTGLLHEKEGTVELELSEIVSGEYVIPRSGHYYKVMMDNRLLAISPSLVDDDFAFPAILPGKNGEGVFNAVGPAGEPIRVLHHRFVTLGKTFDFTVAESLIESREMVAIFKRMLLIAMALGSALLCVAAWLVARMALRPLAHFSTTIETISHQNLTERIDAGQTARELSGLAHSFNDMLARIHTVFESQKRLVADASHELKTPLSVVKTQCDVVLLRERSTAEYVEAIHTVQESVQGMTRLINDLLSLARLDAAPLANAALRPVSLADCLEHGMQLTQHLARERQVQISCSVDQSLTVMGTPTGLEEAFLNLIENGIRYNRPYGTVALTVEQQGGDAVVTVRDTGIGINECDRERIFERFFRAAEVRASNGTGLGLSIVKSIVEAHGGTITVASEPGEGTVMAVVLPLAAGGAV